jgi:hypothetical protein
MGTQIVEDATFESTVLQEGLVPAYHTFTYYSEIGIVWLVFSQSSEDDPVNRLIVREAQVWQLQACPITA